MKAIKFFKFFHNNQIEWRWQDNDGVEDVLAWIPFHALGEFTKMLPYTLLDEGGIEVNLQCDCIALWLGDICEYPAHRVIHRRSGVAKRPRSRVHIFVDNVDCVNVASACPMMRTYSQGHSPDGRSSL